MYPPLKTQERERFFDFSANFPRTESRYEKEEAKEVLTRQIESYMSIKKQLSKAKQPNYAIT